MAGLGRKRLLAVEGQTPWAPGLRELVSLAGGLDKALRDNRSLLMQLDFRRRRVHEAGPQVPRGLEPLLLLQIFLSKTVKASQKASVTQTLKISEFRFNFLKPPDDRGVCSAP